MAQEKSKAPCDFVEDFQYPIHPWDKKFLDWAGPFVEKNWREAVAIAGAGLWAAMVYMDFERFMTRPRGLLAAVVGLVFMLGYLWGKKE